MKDAPVPDRSDRLPRYRAAFQDRFSQSGSTLSSMMASVPGATESARQRIGMFDKTPIKDFSLRQLRDAVQNMQLYWNPLRVVETMQQPGITHVVDALFHRFARSTSCVVCLIVLDTRKVCHPR